MPPWAYKDRVFCKSGKVPFARDLIGLDSPRNCLRKMILLMAINIHYRLMVVDGNKQSVSVIDD